MFLFFDLIAAITYLFNSPSLTNVDKEYQENYQRTN